LRPVVHRAGRGPVPRRRPQRLVEAGGAAAAGAGPGLQLRPGAVPGAAVQPRQPQGVHLLPVLSAERGRAVDQRRRQARSRARGAFLWGAGSFGALHLGLTAAMEYGLRVLRAPYYAFKAARLRRRLGEGDASGTATGAGRPELVVMVGSSRASDGLRGRLIEGDLGRRLGRPVILFNFGIPGDGPMTELLNVERRLADGC